MLSNMKASIVVLALSLVQIYTLENGLARTPPMGWLTWERFRCNIDCTSFPDDCISEQLIKRTADAIVSGGYRDAGYEYVIIDDCWAEMKRDHFGHLHPDRIRFPNGMKSLGDYIHSKGLKFGIYQDYGTHTCGGYPGIIGYEEIDANTFAEWGVDYVKLDGCYSDISTMDEGYPHFGKLLNKTGRKMVYSCSWPVYEEYAGIMPNFELIKEHCNLWRNWDDIQDSWDSMKSITNYFANNQYRIQLNAGPGHWNDPDMLIIGNFGLSLEQSKAQMAVWAILAAPLIMSTDLDRISRDLADILLNRAIISVNQDPLGIQGFRITIINDIEIWTRQLVPTNKNHSNYAVAFVSLRTDGSPYRININLANIQLNNINGYQQYNLYDKRSESKTILQSTNFNVTINPTGCVFYKFVAL